MYLGVSDRYFLHLQPGGGVAYPKPTTEPGNGEESLELDQTAVDIVKLCDGSRTAADLLDLLLGTITAEALQRFIITAIKHGLVEYSKHPSPGGQVNASGSSDYMSPRHLLVELTDQCNLFCDHCYREAGPNLNARLAASELMPILSDAARNGVRVVELSGGEPMMHKEFDAIFLHSMELFALVAVITNGWFVTERRADLLARYRDKLLVQIEIDGPFAELHDGFRRKVGSFERACSTIRRLSERGVVVRMNTSVHPGNLEHLKEIMQLGKDLGASYYSCSKVSDFGRGQTSSRLDASQSREFNEFISEAADANPGYFFPSKELQNKVQDNHINCGAGWNTLVIGPTGEMRPCPITLDHSCTLGNLKTQLGGYSGFLERSMLGPLMDIPAPNENSCRGCQKEPRCGCLASVMQVRDDALARGVEFNCRWNDKYGFFANLPQPQAPRATPSGAGLSPCRSTLSKCT